MWFVIFLKKIEFAMAVTKRHIDENAKTALDPHRLIKKSEKSKVVAGSAACISSAVSIAFSSVPVILTLSSCALAPPFAVPRLTLGGAPTLGGGCTSTTEEVLFSKSNASALPEDAGTSRR